MSRTPADSAIEIVRGATWEDYWDYYEDDGVTPIDLDAYEARLQVRSEDGIYGTTTSTTLLLEALTTGASPKLFIETVPGSASPAKNRVRVKVSAADTVVLNPDNERRVRHGYGIEVFIPAGAEPEYVLPYAQGWANVHGERVR